MSKYNKNLSNKTVNIAVIVAIAFFGILSYATIVNHQNNNSFGITSTTPRIATTIETNEDDYIDVNTELDKIQETELQDTTKTTYEAIADTELQEATTAETEIQEIDDSSITTTAYTTISAETIQTTVEATTTESMLLQETQTSSTVSGGSPNNNGGGNNSENHFTDYNISEQQNTTEYVLNTHTMKFHIPSCDSVPNIKPENYATIESREEAINNGYAPCGKCHP